MDTLPNELKLELLSVAPRLRFCSRQWYKLHNHLCKTRYHKLIPSNKDPENTIAHSIRRYLNSLKFWNGALQDLAREDDDSELLWWICLSFLTNRNLAFFGAATDRINGIFVERTGTPVEDDSISVIQAFSINYEEPLRLISGVYSVYICVRVTDLTRGLGTLKTSIVSNDGSVDFRGFPPTNVVDLIPHYTSCLLHLGEVEIPQGKNGLWTDLKIIVEETGMIQKQAIDLSYIKIKRNGPVGCKVPKQPLYYQDEAGEFDMEQIEKDVHFNVRRVVDLGMTTGRKLPLDLTEEELDSLKQYYTTGTLVAKMKSVADQRRLAVKEEQELKSWKVPF